MGKSTGFGVFLPLLPISMHFIDLKRFCLYLMF